MKDYLQQTALGLSLGAFSYIIFRYLMCILTDFNHFFTYIAYEKLSFSKSFCCNTFACLPGVFTICLFKPQTCLLIALKQNKYVFNE